MPSFQIRHGRVLQTVEYTTSFLRTMTPKWIYGPMRRDIVTAARLGNSYQPVVMEDLPTHCPAVGVDETVLTGGSLALTSPLPIGGLLTAAGTAVVTAFEQGLQDIPVIGGGSTMKEKSLVQTDLFETACDDITHTGSRADPQLRTLIEYWDSETAPGVPQAHFGAPTSGSYDVVIAANATLTVGQLVTSPTAFPVAAMVVAIKQTVVVVDGTGETQRSGLSVTLSKKALTSTAELLTFTGSQLLAWHTPEGDIVGGGTFSTIR